MAKAGRRAGFSPINGNGGAMVKKNKAWSMPEQCWRWLESQGNQSEALRNGVEKIMAWADKAELIKNWQHAHYFNEREIEYLSMKVVNLRSLFPLSARNDDGSWDAEDHERQTEINQQLDDIWDSLEKFEPKDRVILMTRPASHPEVQAIIQS